MTVIGMHRTVTVGVTAAYRPTATLTGTLSKKLKLDLGREVVLIGLGDSPTAALHAIRDDLDALLNGEAA